MSHSCKILQASAENIDLCVNLLRDGAVLGVPTETVYGLAGNALKEESVRKIFEVKGRPLLDPLIVHFSSIKQAEAHVEFNERARALADQFWPGALTLVLRKKNTISDLVTAGLPSVAVRVPGHPIFRNLLERLEFPLAAPSANPFGYVSPTLAEHVAATLGDRVFAVLDGGACEHGVESTIADLRNPNEPMILRPGPLSAEQLGMQNVEMELKQPSNKTAQPAPGMLSLHYSPNTPITLLRHGEKPSCVQKSEAVLYNTKPAADKLAENTFWLSESGDLTEIAHNLFMLIQKLDVRGYTQLLVERTEDVDIGIAVNDRLSRAAAKR